MTVEGCGRFGPIKPPVFFLNYRGVGGAGVGLRFGRKRTGQNRIEVPANHAATQRRQLVVQRRRRLVRRDRHRFPDEHRPRVEAWVHLHQTDTCFHITRQNGVLDRRCASPARQ